MIIVVNYGGQTAHLIARRVRELGVYSHIVPHDITVAQVKKLQPEGIILSGGPNSVYEKGAPSLDKKILDLGIPVLGICYGQQLLSKLLGGKVGKAKAREYGRQFVTIQNGTLFKGLSRKEEVWMSHGDHVLTLPSKFITVASTPTCPHAAIQHRTKKLYGIQFHPEVTHTKHWQHMFHNFLFVVCKTKKTWVLKDMIPSLVQDIKKKVGNHSVIMGVSGGVDSTVAAALLKKALGDRVFCVFIDHGLIRKNEAGEVKQFFTQKMKLKHFTMVDASKTFLSKLKGVKDPEKKRKIIGHTFIRVFEQEVMGLEKKHKNITFLGQGTIYPDRIESAQPNKKAHKIKSHHNLTLPKDMRLKVVEPLKEFYKDEVRKLGKELKIPQELLSRHPFPGPGLAIRILGEITSERLRIVRESDHIFITELKKSGYYQKTWQAFAALFPVKSVGVQGDTRTYEYVISLRAVNSVDAMTADWSTPPHELLGKISTRIINEVKGVNRVVFDITQKPPGTIEYE